MAGLAAPSDVAPPGSPRGEFDRITAGTRMKDRYLGLAFSPSKTTAPFESTVNQERRLDSIE
jgi:hypothetical protein